MGTFILRKPSNEINLYLATWRKREGETWPEQLANQLENLTMRLMEQLEKQAKQIEDLASQVQAQRLLQEIQMDQLETNLEKKITCLANGQAPSSSLDQKNVTYRKHSLAAQTEKVTPAAKMVTPPVNESTAQRVTPPATLTTARTVASKTTAPQQPANEQANTATKDTKASEAGAAVQPKAQTRPMGQQTKNDIEDDGKWQVAGRRRRACQEHAPVNDKQHNKTREAVKKSAIKMYIGNLSTVKQSFGDVARYITDELKIEVLDQQLVYRKANQTMGIMVMIESYLATRLMNRRNWDENVVVDTFRERRHRWQPETRKPSRPTHSAERNDAAKPAAAATGPTAAATGPTAAATEPTAAATRPAAAATGLAAAGTGTAAEATGFAAAANGTAAAATGSAAAATGSAAAATGTADSAGVIPDEQARNGVEKPSTDSVESNTSQH